MFRFFEIIWVFSKNFLAFDVFNRKPGSLGKKLKKSFEELGLTFIKIGQILSMRYDVLSEKDCEILQELLDKVKSVPYKEIETVFVEDFGKKPEVLFEDFDRNPIASASVSQVYRATLKSGEKVAVKVKKPLVDKKVKQDMDFIRRLIFVVKIFIPVLRHPQTKEVINFFHFCLQNDINFEKEIENMELVSREYFEIGENNKKSGLGKGVFPKPYRNFCSENIIVMDFMEGIPLSRFKEIKNNPDYDVEKSVRTYISSIRAWFSTDNYVFQGDPHFSNIMVMPGGNVASVDAGLIGEFSKWETRITKDLFLAVYLSDFKETMRALEKMVPGDDLSVIEKDIELYLERARYEGIGYWFMEIARIFIKHNLNCPTFLLLFARTVYLIDGLIEIVTPGKTMIDFLGEELEAAAIKESLKGFEKVDLLALIYTISKKVRNFQI